jgi:hypothetical protein
MGIEERKCVDRARSSSLVAVVPVSCKEQQLKGLVSEVPVTKPEPLA